jgi:hypothetical protein
MINMRDKILKPEIIAVACAAILIVSMLMTGPIIGVADNGDFYRIMVPSQLAYLTNDDEERYFSYFNSKYSITEKQITSDADFVTTHLIPIKLAITINKLFLKNGIFDIRFLSSIYMIIFLISIYLLIKSIRLKSKIANWILAFLTVFFFVDVGYIAYFNSLYGEAMSYVFLLLCVGIGIHISTKDRPRIFEFISFFIAAFFFVGAKQQNSPLVILFLIIFARMLTLRKDFIWRTVVIVCSIAILSSSVFIYSFISREIRNINIHQAVFFGILKGSTTPEKDLEELGINTGFAVLAGKTYFDSNVAFSPTDAIMQSEFFGKITYGRILMFYIKHPLRLYQKMEITARNAFRIRQSYLGNFEKSANKQRGQMASFFGGWSYLKEIGAHNFFALVALFYISFYSIWYTKYKETKSNARKLKYEAIAMVGIVGMVQFALPYIADGEGDLSKHLFIFDVCFDIMFVASIAWISLNIKHTRALFHSNPHVRSF